MLPSPKGCNRRAATAGPPAGISGKRAGGQIRFPQMDENNGWRSAVLSASPPIVDLKSDLKIAFWHLALKPYIAPFSVPSPGDAAIDIPQILPALGALPQKDLPLHQAAVLVIPADGLHLLLA